MTVNDLISVWLHNKDPNSRLLIWSRKLVDYIFDSKHIDKYDSNLEDLGKQDVQCFQSYLGENNKTVILSINVD